MDHLLTCECGRKLTVTRKQAGQELQCECGRKLSVPTLRGFSELPVAAATSAVSLSSSEAARSAWSGWRGPTFALAVGVALIAAVATARFLLQRSMLDTSYTAETEVERGNEIFDEYSPVELSLTWDDYQKFSFTRKMTPPFVQVKRYARDREVSAMITGGLCLASSLLAGGIWLSARRRRVPAQ